MSCSKFQHAATAKCGLGGLVTPASGRADHTYKGTTNETAATLQHASTGPSALPLTTTRLQLRRSSVGPAGTAPYADADGAPPHPPL
jgi:hypothetical protein